MRRLWSWMLAVVLVGCVGQAAWTGPVNAGDVSPKAMWVAHLDVEALVASRMGQYLLEVGRKEHRLDEGLRALSEFAGFDPLKDVSGITLYGTAHAPSSGVVVLRGKFDPGRLLGLLEMNPDYRRNLYHEHVVHRWTQAPEDAKDDGVRHGTFVGQNMIVIARGETVLHEALDVVDGRAAGRAEVLPKVAAGTFLFAAAREIPVPDEATPTPQSQLLKAIANGTIEVGEAAGMAFGKTTVNARKAEDATQLRLMLGGLVAFARFGGAQQNEPWMPLLKAARVGGEESTVQLQVEMKTQELLDLAETLRKAQGK